jgi:hypothetical protein
MQAFQPDAFQQNAFQDAAAGAAVPAFQRCAFQFGVFQVLPCADTAARNSGGIVRRKKKPQLGIDKLPSAAERDDERRRLGILPPRVQRIIRQLAQDDVQTLEPDEQALSNALRIELARQRIAYQDKYEQALMQMREALVREEIRQLLTLAQAEQQRQQQQQQLYREMMQREEDDLVFLLTFA